MPRDYYRVLTVIAIHLIEVLQRIMVLTHHITCNVTNAEYKFGKPHEKRLMKYGILVLRRVMMKQKLKVKNLGRDFRYIEYGHGNDTLSEHERDELKQDFAIDVGNYYIIAPLTKKEWVLINGEG
jgi:hypothetical protein